MALSCKNVLIGELLLGAGYLIGMATRQPTVVAISAPTPFQDAADMAGKGSSMALWLLFACSVLFLVLCMIGRKKKESADSVADESLNLDFSNKAPQKREASTWTSAVARMASAPVESQKAALAYEHAHLNFDERVQVLARPVLRGDRVIT